QLSSQGVPSRIVSGNGRPQLCSSIPMCAASGMRLWSGHNQPGLIIGDGRLGMSIDNGYAKGNWRKRVSGGKQCYPHRAVQHGVGEKLSDRSSFSGRECPLTSMGCCSRPLRAQDRLLFEAVLCGALAAAERHAVGRHLSHRCHLECSWELYVIISSAYNL